MLIVCPQCESRYEIADGEVPDEGRLVRCVRCRAEWRVHVAAAEAGAAGEDAAVAAEAGEDLPAGVRMLQGVPDLAARQSEEASAMIEHADVETEAARRSERLRRRPARAAAIHFSPSAIRTLVLVAGVAAIVLAVQFRAGVVRAFPASASLFAQVGLPVNLRGLEFSAVKTSAAVEGDAPVLVVDGEIRNITGKPQKVPGLRLSIQDDKGVEIYGWTAAPARNSLEPGAVMPFKSRLASPPPEGRAVAVRFVRPEDKVAMK